MTLPALALIPTSDLSSSNTDLLVLGVQRTDDGPVLLTRDPAFAQLSTDLAEIGFTGAADEFRRLPGGTTGFKSIALIGVGSTLTANEMRYAAGSAARQLRGVPEFTITIPHTEPGDLLAIAEGAAIGAYDYNDYRVDSLEGTKLHAASITIATTLTDGIDGVIARATAVARAIDSVRDLVNAPPSHLYPETFANAAIMLAQGLPVEVTVLAEEELAAEGFGGILGMGQGSSRGPRLVKVSYSPAGATKHLALVGKGITFDSGGLSLKPPTAMIGMKYDMAGAATVLGVVLAAAELELDIRMTAWLCLAENMPSGTATRPNDVLRIRGGKTVEVLNTDAEGRLVLADGIVAASEEFPDAIIDVATLTGAQVTALGNRYVGAMGDDLLVSRLVSTADRVGETLWPMPLPSDLRSMLNSDVADIANIKPGNTAAGMLIAGVFLKDFVGTTGEGENKRPIPWAHLDIAGPANNGGGGYGFVGKGPTGVTVRALLAVAEDISLA